jgi:hypothetical protein
MAVAAGCLSSLKHSGHFAEISASHRAPSKEIPMATQPRIDFEVSARCRSGQHRPKRVPINAHEGEVRSTCRDCGAVLVRTRATRQWFYSGPLA